MADESSSRDCEDSTRKSRMENNELLKQQKEMQSRATELRKLVEDTNNRRLKRMGELQDELRDLEFFVRTQNEVSVSNLKEDIQAGSLVVIPGTPAASSSGRLSGSGGKRNNSGNRVKRR